MKRTVAIALGVLLLCLGTITPAHAAVLTLTPITLGNVFTDGQQVKIGLATDATSVTWSAADVNGTVVATGSQAAASTLQVSVTTRGWYQLTVQAGTTTARTTFAILSPLSTSAVAGLTTNRIGDFENAAEGWTFYPGSEYPGATGSFALDSAGNHSGTNSGKLSGNFSGGGAYVSVNRTLPSVTATSVSFWAKTSNLSFLTFRLTDSTGQVHQQRLTLSASTDWQPLAVPRFDGGKQYVHFGGANDGVWHGPAKQVEVVMDKAAITAGGTSGSVSLDDFTVNAPASTPTTPLGDFDSAAEGWSFYPGSEFPGATGSLTYDTAAPHAGAQSAKLTADFTGGGNYVALQRTFVPIDLKSLSLWVKTSQVSAIGLRLTDATGQVHQQRLTLSGSTAWQQLNVTRFDGGTAYLHFGGADDGVWHGPAKAITLTLDKALIIGGGTTAAFNIDAVATTTSPTLQGTGTHFNFAWNPDVVPLITQAGARGGRDEASWSDAETTRGVYTFPAKVTSYLQSWQSNGVDPLIIADYGNCLYDCPGDGFNAPYTDAGRAAFANYADALASQYPQVKNIAVWNEWDMNAGGPANYTPDSYLALLKATYTKLKANHPGLTVVAGGDNDVNQQAWFQAFCQLGGLKYLDVVSIHPYNFLGAPESLGAKLDQIRATIRQYNGGVDKPIWITEAGWYTSGGVAPVSEPTQAMYLAREMLDVPGHDIDRFYAYDFKNDGIDPVKEQQNYGLVHHESDALGKYTPKPAYVAYATAARQLRGATFLGKESPGNGLIDQVYAANDGTPFRAIWAASGSNTTVTVNATGPIQVTSLYGLSSTFTPNANGQVTVTVGVWPTYISGSGVTSITAP